MNPSNLLILFHFNLYRFLNFFFMNTINFDLFGNINFWQSIFKKIQFFSIVCDKSSLGRTRKLIISKKEMKFLRHIRRESLEQSWTKCGPQATCASFHFLDGTPNSMKKIRFSKILFRPYVFTHIFSCIITYINND